MEVNRESIYGCGETPFGGVPVGSTVGLTTAKGNTVYLHVFRWPGKEICIAGVKKKVKSAYLLASKEKGSVRGKADR